MPPRKVLVVYYSRSGTTRVLADLIAASLEAEVEEIEDLIPRSGLGGWLRSAYEATLIEPAVIRPQQVDPARYDLVVVGTPVWNARVSSPIRTWLRINAARLPAVALFATQGSRGGDKAVFQMMDLVGKAPRATLVARNDAVWLGRTVAPVASFVRTIEQSGPSVPAPPMTMWPAYAH